MSVFPRLSVIAGPNGSGKSTLYQKLSHRFEGNLVNADLLAEKLGSITKGGREALKVRNRLLSEKDSFTLETTLSGIGPLRLISRALEQKYDVRLYFVSLDDPIKNAQRVQERVQKGGHDVSMNHIERRYKRSLENLPVALSLANRSYVYDNSTSRLRLIFVKSGQRIRINTNWKGQLPFWLPNQIQEFPGAKVDQED